MSGAVMNKVVISYAWETTAHQENVVSLANALRDDGFESSIDLFIAGMPPEGLPDWMIRQIRWANTSYAFAPRSIESDAKARRSRAKAKA